jgi:Zn-dependent protease with chaperone function
MTTMVASTESISPNSPAFAPRVDIAPLIDAREQRRFVFCVFAAVLGYTFIIGMLVAAAKVPVASVFLGYGIAIFAFVTLTHMLFVGRIRGNAVRVSPEQFPELHQLLEAHANRLAMPVPAMYILQAGGVLNAFAVKYFRRKFVVVFSDVIEIAEQHGPDAVSFIVGHELAHHKRNHPTKFKWLTPARLIPFAMPAYSRACEYTCDAIGGALAPSGASAGLLALAAGGRLFPRVDARQYAGQAVVDHGLSVRMAEIFSTHPHLTKRVAAVLRRTAM